MTWSLQQKAKYLLDEKMTSFLVVVATKMVVKKKGKVVWRSQKQVVTFFCRGRDQFGPKKLVVTFWSGATKCHVNADNFVVSCEEQQSA